MYTFFFFFFGACFTLYIIPRVQWFELCSPTNIELLEKCVLCIVYILPIEYTLLDSHMFFTDLCICVWGAIVSAVVLLVHLGPAHILISNSEESAYIYSLQVSR